MTMFVAVVAGVAAGIGVWGAVQAVRGVNVFPRVPGGSSTLPGRARFAVVGVSVLVGLVVWVLTGWPVAALAAASVGWLAPRVAAEAQSRGSQVDRALAVATWTEMIRDSIAGKGGVETALVQASEVAPGPISSELRRFLLRRERGDLVESLLALADDLNDPTADFVIAALVAAVRTEVRELAPLLGRLAEATRAEVAMWSRVDVARSRSRGEAGLVLAGVVGVMVLLVVMMGDLLVGYDTVMGQVWMAAVFAWVGWCGWMLLRMSRIEVPDRFRIRKMGVSR